MNISITEILTALILIAAAFVLVFLFLKYKLNTSKRRMRQMMERCGLDPEIVAQGDKRTIMQEIRRRCGKCQAEDVCERWLAEEGPGENSFCPNAETFRLLAKSS